ncbi:MAG: TonB-dependent receptor [Bacteroidia bacterium]|nr:TonB-dependent receptor [Bacteroidia bacterium]
MKRLLIIILVVITFNFESVAQLTQTIKGTVVDKDSKTKLIGVNIIVKNTNPILGCNSDINGSFRIEKVPVGHHTLVVTYIGYENLIIPEILVGTGKEVFLSIELTESVSQLKEITVSGNSDKGKPINEMASVSSRSFSVDEASRYAGNANDISRIAQSYAGVSSNDTYNELIIRGNSSRGLLWRLEGIEVPNLNHLSTNGSSGGGLSILSVNVLKNSDFYTGAFPAEYGNALSGVFDVKLRNGNSEKHEYAIQAGFMGLEAEMEGPFSKNKRASYLVNYRYSTLGLFDKMGLKLFGGDVVIPRFHDLTLKFNFPTKNKGTFTLFGIGGISSTVQLAKKDSALWENTYNKFEATLLSNMFASGLIHKYFFNEKAYLTSFVSVSGNENGVILDSLDNKYVFNSTLNSNVSGLYLRISSALNYKFNSKNTFRTGIIYSNIRFNLLSESKVKQIVYVNSDGSTDLAQFYAEWKHRFNEKFTLNTGFHSTYFALSSSSSLEPRFSLQWNISSIQSLSIGAGIHSKTEPLTLYFAQIPQTNGTYVTPNKNLRLSKAQHYVLSYENQLAENLKLKIETYYQYLYDVPVENNIQSGFSVLNFNDTYPTMFDNNANVALINKGTGTNYGIEITFEKYFSKNYYFLVTGSLYESKYKAMDNVERNTRYNNNFITNFIGGKEFKIGKNKTDVIVTDIKFVWSGGPRLTPIDVEKSRTLGITVFDVEHRYTEKSPDYFKFNFKIGYRKNNKKSSHYIFLELQNVTNHKNIASQYYNPIKNEIYTYYQLGFLPILNYRVQF